MKNLQKRKAVAAGRMLLSSLAAMAAAFIACDKTVCRTGMTEKEQEEELGVLTIGIDNVEGFVTKADLHQWDYEQRISNLQVFVFDAATHKLNAYRTGIGLNGCVISTTTGQKTVYVVANGPDLGTIKDESALNGTVLSLSQNSKSTGFVMYGKKSCNLSASGTACSVTVSKLAARITLASVSNSLPPALGQLEIQRVFLANVCGNVRLDGSEAGTAVFYNKDGRMDESSRNRDHIINGTSYTASVPDLTFASISENIANGAKKTWEHGLQFYSCPNRHTSSQDSFTAAWVPQCTSMVVVAGIDNSTYYYPVKLNKSALEAGKTYSVQMTITGFGSNDPNSEVSKGSLSVSISVEGWKSGTDYTENY